MNSIVIEEALWNSAMKNEERYGMAR